MDREKVGTRKNVVERRELDLEIARLFWCDKRIVSDDEHAHRSRARRDDAPDATESDDAQRLALQLDADKLLAIPTARFETAARLRNRTRERDEHRDGVLRGRDRVAVRRVHHHPAAPP